MTENEAKDFLGRFSLDRIEYANGKEVDMERFDYFTEVLVTAMKALSEIQQYRAIGTVEECQQAKERQRAKKPFKALEHQKKAGYKHKCPKCGCAVGYIEKTPFRKRVLVEHAALYCCICGQKLDWSE